MLFLGGGALSAISYLRRRALIQFLAYQLEIQNFLTGSVLVTGFFDSGHPTDKD